VTLTIHPSQRRDCEKSRAIAKYRKATKNARQEYCNGGFRALGAWMK
jgi:hypothetical protein